MAHPTATAGSRRVPAFALALATAAVLFLSGARAQSPAFDPATLPARDAHQGLLIAVRPDATLESSKARFGQRSPYGAGLLGLDVYLRNDGDVPIDVTRDTVQLFIGAPGEKQQRLDQIFHDRVADLILSTASKDPTATRRTPIPTLGIGPAHDKNWVKLDDALRAAALPPMVAVQPHATAHGYLYYNIEHQFPWLSNARLDIPDVAFATTHQALLFFEIDLDPSAPGPGGAR